MNLRYRKNTRKGKAMKLTPKNLSRIQNDIIPELPKHYGKTGEPVALNDLPLWESLSKSNKIKLGRGFKQMVLSGEVEGIKFAGVRKDNHSTYIPTSAGGGISGLFSKLFR